MAAPLRLPLPRSKTLDSVPPPPRWVQKTTDDADVRTLPAIVRRLGVRRVALYEERDPNIPEVCGVRCRLYW